LDVLLIAMLVDHEPPVALRGMGRPEILEVECEDREIVAFRERHHRRVGVAELESGELCIDRDGSAKQRCGPGNDGVLPRSDRLQEQTCRVTTDTRAQQLVDFDDDGLRDQQAPAELGDERGRKAVGPIAAVRGCDQRPGVGDDPQRASTRFAR
jgi:hypothetical protein